ncbi:restriction endonuclease subunit S [Synechococcus sp. M16CYN]|uniref:restriction endonuclease subunit S n=1 Tax=Synechococcus sp. M16CYN TaxID=3103139 RepID=UPI003342D619
MRALHLLEEPPIETILSLTGEIYLESSQVKLPRLISGPQKNGITTHGMCTSAAKLIDAGSVLIAMYGATTGQVARLKIPAATNQAVLAIKPKDDLLCADFLYHYLRQSKDDLIATCQGSGQPNLNAGIVKGFLIEFSPLPE